MASFGAHLSFFFLLVLFFSLQIQARESKFFSKVTSFITINNAKKPHLSLPKTPAPAPAPELVVAVPIPASAPESVLGLTPSPAPIEAESQDGYGLYGRDPSQLTPTKEAPATKIDESELLEEEIIGESYNPAFPRTNLYSNNNNGNPSTYNNKGPYVSNYNSNGEYNSNYNNNYKSNSYNNKGYYHGNGYNNNNKGYYNGNGYNNNNNKGYYNGNGYNNNNNNKGYYNGNGYNSNNNNNNKGYYNGNGYNNNNYNGYNNNNNNYNNDGYNNKKKYNNNGYDQSEIERQGLSDTRVLENSNYYSKVNGYESEKGSTRNEVNYENNMYPNEFNTMEEYEKQQESQGYVP
ncbi:protein E6-like [Quillaja saponaria]|uniref:Protein E6-like n=1 Tax=Quillaja saponaria TaxID=32244 RepID=A0AAD7QIP6_QUISA|nr:protein E6-like [Quillaja saponaria]